MAPIIRENPITGNFVRNYFWGNQLAYLGIASSKSIGIFHATEPFTGTGRSIYPSGYYNFIGLVASFFHLPLASSQNLVFISASVLILFLTSRLLAAHFMKSSVVYALLVPIVLGTLNTFLSGKWSLGLKTHAVIWPISADLYSANAESIGLLITTLIVFNFLIFRVRQSE